MVAPPGPDEKSKRFYVEHDRVVARAAALQAMRVGWIALNAAAGS